MVIAGISQFRYIRSDMYNEVSRVGEGIGETFREVIAEDPGHFTNERGFLQDMVIRISNIVPHILRISVVDRSLIVVADTEPANIGRKENERGLIKLIQDPGKSRYIYKQEEKKFMRLGFSILGKYDPAFRSPVIGAVSFDINLNHVDRQIMENFLYLMTLTFIIMTAVWSAGYLFFVRSAVRRLNQITMAAERFGMGIYSTRTDDSGNDEISTLSGTFNSMASKIESTTKSLESEITRRRDIEKLQEELIKKLDSANRELNDFAYIVSHDLKAPLRAIGTITGWLAEDYKEKLDNEGKDQLNILMQRTQRMNHMIEGILQYSRVGNVTGVLDLVETGAVVNDVIKSLLIPPNIRVTVQECLAAVTIDSIKLNQVFQNLIGNAVKYMDKTEGLIEIGCRDSGEFFEFYVTDNGPGIDSRHYERIFQIFQTLRPRDEFESTGIGLTIVRKIITQNGGRIWVESEVGKGSTFRFTLPKKTKKDG